ncbi:Chemotaxis regulator BdlA [Achromobacter sp. 2789STDY5608615]|uniref:hypothetical protein n=1 Tax=Achromobacter sp. 2789STDY5608615 TaxID=1806492 RepID=UPI0006C3A8F8|nr:hypothetical protein [Achromobacter sp. 2789STDY5608615]CUK14313.1 Chemotaxis regulator BdlA [Achromobacter sp. 2789STDY5608615]
MLDSHPGGSSAAPQGAAWQVSNYLASMDRALLLFDFDAAGALINANDNFLAALGYARADIAGLRHDLLCDSMDEGKGIASAEHIWARLRRGEVFPAPAATASRAARRCGSRRPTCRCATKAAKCAASR